MSAASKLDAHLDDAIIELREPPAGTLGARMRDVQPPPDRSDLIAMGHWVADCLDADNHLVWRTVVRRLADENEALGERVDDLRYQLGRAIREREEWEANERDQHHEAQRLRQALIDICEIGDASSTAIAAEALTEDRAEGAGA